jgi:carbon-monoxide dehydrogenase medium subunit
VHYYRPTSTAQAVDALASDPGAARVIVGGTDLLVALRGGRVAPTLLVDIKSARDLRPPVSVDDTGITFGPTATMSQVARHPVVRTWFPGLVEAALLVGSVAIRNRASLIANSANGSPAADTSPVLVALGGQVTIASTSGERTAEIRDFFLASRRTLCAPGELVTSLRVPRPSPSSSSAYERMTRRRGVDLASCSVGVVVESDGSTTAGLGAVGPRTLLAGPTGPCDVGSGDELDRAIDVLVQPATPISDLRAGQAYRAAMLRVLAKRAILRAVGRRTAEPVAAPGEPIDTPVDPAAGLGGRSQT